MKDGAHVEETRSRPSDSGATSARSAEPPTSPSGCALVRVELAALLDRAKSALADADRAADRWGNVRLALALIGLALLLMPLYTRSGTPWWGLVPIGLSFLALGKLQDRLLERRRVAAASVLYFEGSIARLEETWRSLPEQGLDVGKPWTGSVHPADDLDLFGPASLYQLLSRAVTAEGRRTLARWIAEPAPWAEVAERQAAVRALAADIELRRRCFAAAAVEEGNRSLEDEALLTWAEGSRPMPARRALKVLGVVQPVLLFAAAAWAFILGGPREPLYLLLVLQTGTLFLTRKLTAHRASVLSGPERSLNRYARLIEVVESIPAGKAQRLDALRRRLQGSRPASQELRRLERLVEMLNARLNMFFALTLGPALLWELNVVLRAEDWRDETGPRLRAWLSALGEMEALASLGAFAHERPDYAFPELDEAPGTFDAEHLQHPLIDRRRVVGNDLRLGGPGSVLILSGSNMSGKSTLLRSVGLAVVLAGAGAPVAARRLRISDLRLATSVRVVDSLAAGASHFYAELRRLKHVIDLASRTGPTLLYLLDEMLHGTNSRERFVGAVSVVKWLSEAGAVGLVTTHDLELGRVSEMLPGGRVSAAHFSDDVSGDGLRFDYVLRPGPVQTTNALRLMRAVGISVELVEP